MPRVFIGIGSNLGDRHKNCEAATLRLQTHPHIKNLIKSAWYGTEAVVPEERRTKNEERFINGAACFETDLPPQKLLEFLQEIEAELGRLRTGKKWEPRTIDLDILFYDDLIIDTPQLKIPHPELHKRMFVLRPLCDIAPKLIHPVLKKTAKQLLEEQP